MLGRVAVVPQTGISEAGKMFAVMFAFQVFVLNPTGVGDAGLPR